MRLPDRDTSAVKCVKCGSDEVGKTNPHFITIFYLPLLYFLKQVNYHCFDCGHDWWDYYFK